MNTLWIVSMVLQWIIIAGLCVLTLSLVRQLGLVTVRLNPSAGFDSEDGPGPGTEISAQEVELFPGGAFVIGGVRASPLLVVFLSPDCSMCTSVANHARAIHQTYRESVDLLTVVQGTPRVVREFVDSHGLQMPVALRQHFPSEWAPGSTPYGLAVTEEGTVAARGVPNALEHLEEMIKIAEEGLPMDHRADPVEHVWGDGLPTSQNGNASPQHQTAGPGPGQVVLAGDRSEDDRGN